MPQASSEPNRSKGKPMPLVRVSEREREMFEAVCRKHQKTYAETVRALFYAEADRLNIEVPN